METIEKISYFLLGVSVTCLAIGYYVKNTSDFAIIKINYNDDKLYRR